jgi:flavin-dependent dehydrogenase
MERFHTEICIVGAGPAGIYAAIKLAQNSIPSILVDKSFFPRDKVCGEAITSAVLRYIQKIEPDILSDETFLNKRNIINGMKVYAPSKKNVHVPYKSIKNLSLGLVSAIGIKRVNLDNILLNYAKKYPLITIKEGLHIDDAELINDSVLLLSKERNVIIQADMVVVANGYASKLTQKLAKWEQTPKEDACGITTYFRNVPEITESDLAECFILEELRGGGMYILPVGNGVVNVNVAVKNEIVKKYKLNLRQIMFTALQTHPALKDRFQNAVVIKKPAGFGYHLGIRKRTISGDRFLLIGDAGGFNDAITANGIEHAMRSAEIATDIISDCYSSKSYSKEHLFRYEKKIYKAFRSKRISGALGTRLIVKTKLVFFLINKFVSLSPSTEVLSMMMYSKRPVLLIFSPKFYATLFKPLFKKINFHS